MTILPKTEQVQGKHIHGFQISCHVPTCHATNFINNSHNIPEQQIPEKFRQRGWQVLPSGVDTCPECLHKKRDAAAKPAKFKQDQSRIKPARQILPISVGNIRNLLIQSGLPIETVAEIEARSFRFKVTFKPNVQIRVGTIVHAEGELVEALNASLKSSFLENELMHTADSGVIHVKMKTHWFLNLEDVRALVAAE